MRRTKNLTARPLRLHNRGSCVHKRTCRASRFSMRHPFPTAPFIWLDEIKLAIADARGA